MSNLDVPGVVVLEEAQAFAADPHQKVKVLATQKRRSLALVTSLGDRTLVEGAVVLDTEPDATMHSVPIKIGGLLRRPCDPGRSDSVFYLYRTEMGFKELEECGGDLRHPALTPGATRASGSVAN